MLNIPQESDIPQGIPKNLLVYDFPWTRIDEDTRELLRRHAGSDNHYIASAIAFGMARASGARPKYRKVARDALGLWTQSARVTKHLSRVVNYAWKEAYNELKYEVTPEMLDVTPLSPNAAVVYKYLFGKHGVSETFQASKRDVAKSTELHPTTAERCLTELVAKCFLSVEHPGGPGVSKTYKLNSLHEYEQALGGK